jgi:putative tryptophan/tyrosine transport system substrate-binding protein
MRRRAVIVGLLLATVARAHAQQQKRVYRIALASPSDAVSEMTETGSSPYWSAFFKRLRELGYVEGQTLTVTRHSGEGRTENFSDLAIGVVRSNPDVIFVQGDRLTNAVRAATDTIPLVAVVGDPVAAGVASSLARPGGNVTGVTVNAGPEFVGKYLELLHEMVPGASRVAWLASPGLWKSPYAATLRDAAQRIGISLVGPPLDAPFQEAEYRRAFAAFSQESVDALTVSSQPENRTNRRLIVELAAEARLPALHPYPEFAHIGGLMAFGVDLADMYRHAADQADQILKSAKAGEIPFYQPTKFTLVINLKTAKALGIPVPPTLLIAADEVIE